MKATLIKITAAALLATSGLASADSHIEQGTVISAIPIYETVRVPTEREVCWDEEVRYRKGHSPTAPPITPPNSAAVGLCPLR